MHFPPRRFLALVLLLLVAGAVRYFVLEPDVASPPAVASDAVRIDPDAPVTVPHGTLVIVTGMLAAQDAASDPVYHFTRPGVLALHRQVDAFDRGLLERELEAPDAVRDPGEWTASGDFHWLIPPDFVLTGTDARPVTRWQPRAAGGATDAESTHTFHGPARIGQLALSEALVRTMTMYRRVTLEGTDLAKVPQPLRGRLLLNNGSYTTGEGDAVDDLRISFFEFRSEVVTLIAECRDGALHVWHNPATDAPFPLARPGRMEVTELLRVGKAR